MGIAYDWVNQRHIKRKTKGKQRQVRNNDAIICLGPIISDIRQWHFSFRGAGDGVYSRGIYHGVILLPKDYPLSPPSVSMWTPSGRFVPHKSICLTATNYHPESWTPRWSIQGLVNALRLHMLTKPDEIGGMTADADEILEFARQSLDWKVTWTQTNSNNKKTRITVDHGLLLQEGVLSLGLEHTDGSDETLEEIKEPTDDESMVHSDTTTDTNELSDINEDIEQLVTELKEKLEVNDEIARVAVSKSDKNKKKLIEGSARKMDMIVSVLQLAVLYMVVLLFFNR